MGYILAAGHHLACALFEYSVLHTSGKLKSLHYFTNVMHLHGKERTSGLEGDTQGKVEHTHILSCEC